MWKSLPFFLGVVAVAVGQRILVDDLELETAIGKYESPADITFTKDGTLWACNKRGILTVSAPGDYDNPKRVLDLRDQLCENGERGLLGVAPHPDFGEDEPYVYIMYTYKKNGNCNENGSNGPVMRLSRFTCDAGGDLECDVDSEEVFLESPSFPFDHHNSGAITFGKDGMIYATIGDGGESPTAQDRSNLFGVIVRLTADNKIPDGNPYADEDDSVRCGFNGGESGGGGKRCQEIFAYGLRNPFRMSMNPNKGKTEFHVNDVGASLWEEVSIGGDGYKGANYGWPFREGPCKKGSECGRLCNRDDNYVEPEHFYHHDSDDEGAITAGAFVPEGIWPEAYDGKYLYADYVFGRIYVMDPSGNENRDVCPMTSNYDPVPLIRFPEAFISAMAFSPIDSSLYFLTRGGGGRLNKISHVGLVNRQPQPKIKTSALGGEVGTTIEFDASESTDPDGHELTYEWDFDGDGEVDSREEVTTFTFNEAGIYEVELKVRDGFGSRPTATIEIGIGAHPEAEIIEPAEGSDFFVGQEFSLTGSATGPGIEDGDDDSFSWEVKQHHGNHFHPYLEPTKGNPVKLQAAPSPEDFLASENSYLEVILTVTNEFGLKTTVSRNVMPRMRQVSLYSVPANRTILVDNYEVTTPMLFTSWANHPLKVEATDSDWVEWSNNGTQSQVMTLSMESEELVTLVAHFSETEAPATAGPTTSAPTSLAPTTLSPTTLQPTTMAPTVPPTMPPTFPNRDPVAKITTSALGGDVGVVIEFDASESTDLDNDEMIFEWDFDGDGETDSSQPLVTFQYSEVGIYTVTLTVRDGDGGLSTSSVEIGIGQYPTAEILEPHQGSQFHVGEVLILKGTAGGAGISSEEASMNWMVNQHFGDFFNPILLWTNGNNIELPPAPTPEQLLASENSHWEIILKVTNRFGISTTVTRNVTPQLLSVTVTSDPPGRVIRVDSFYVTTPTSFVSWANQDLVLQAIDTDYYGWSEGGEQTHVLTLGDDSSATANADDYSVVAFFEPLSGPPSAAPTTSPASGFNTADDSSSSVVVPSGLIVATLLATIVLGIN